MPAFKSIIYAKRGAIARITLNRPDKMNALSDLLMAELQQALEQADGDNDVRVIVISGAGKHFSTGYDLEGGSTYAALDVKLQQALSITRSMRKTYANVWNTRKPIIAQIRGYCLAGGCYLQMLCDLAVASEGAVFGHPAMASSGPTGMPLWLWLLGARKAKELLLTGRLITGKEAERIGLVNMAVPEERLEAEVELLAQDIAAIPQDSATLTKESINTSLEVMGLTATFRTWSELNALGRYGEANLDIAALRAATKKKLERLPKRKPR